MSRKARFRNYLLWLAAMVYLGVAPAAAQEWWPPTPARAHPELCRRVAAQAAAGRSTGAPRVPTLRV